MTSVVRYRIVFAMLLTLCIVFRLYKIDTPLIEYHSWRQADTAAVARNFTRYGFDLLKPRYDDLSSAQSGIPNPLGYRMVEFPLYNAWIGLSQQLMPSLSFVAWGRLISIFCACVILYCTYHFAAESGGEVAGLISGLVFATFPFFVFYTRVILPEVPALATMMVALYLVHKKNVSRVSLVTSAVLFALSILIKPTTIFYGVAWAYGLARSFNHQKPFMRLAKVGIIAIVACLPLVAWRMHIQNFPEGIPSSEWLIGYVNVEGGLKPIFMRPAFFRWILYERVTLLIMGTFGLPLLLAGLLKKTPTLLPASLLLSTVLYVGTFQGGNVQHEYYQILTLPTIALYAGLGASYLYNRVHGSTRKYLMLVACFTLLGLGWSYSWDRVHHYYYSLSDIPKFAKAVANFVKPDDLIVTDTGGDTTVLYALDRKGSPTIYGGAQQMKDDGYTYVFTYNHETARNLHKDIPTSTMLINDDRFILLKL
ncbi:MAG: glycosyltransferase family 39 protein [bacterium]